MKLYCVRHGQTDYNLEKRNQGQEIDTHLNTTGRDQVSSTLEKLPNHIDAIIASPMNRTVETAEILNNKYNLAITYNPLLIELSYGDLAEKTLEESIAITNDPEYEAKDISAQYDYHQFNGESADDVRVRVLNFFDHLVKEYPNDAQLLIVTHGGIIEAMQSILLDSVEEAKNAQVYEFEI